MRRVIGRYLHRLLKGRVQRLPAGGWELWSGEKRTVMVFNLLDWRVYINGVPQPDKSLISRTLFFLCRLLDAATREEEKAISGTGLTTVSPTILEKLR